MKHSSYHNHLVFRGVDSYWVEEDALTWANRCCLFLKQLWQLPPFFPPPLLPLNNPVSFLVKKVVDSGTRQGYRQALLTQTPGTGIQRTPTRRIA